MCCWVVETSGGASGSMRGTGAALPDIIDAKHTEEHRCPGQCSNIALQQFFRDGDAAYENFFGSLFGQHARAGRCAAVEVPQGQQASHPVALGGFSVEAAECAQLSLSV